MAPTAVLAQAQAMAVKADRKRKRSIVDNGDKEELENMQSEILNDEVISEEDGYKEILDQASVRSGIGVNKGKGKSKGTESDVFVGDAGKASIFKQKTLILSSRGITHRMRHMMKDLAMLLPHSKSDAKLDTKHQLSLLNELADLSNCSSLLFFEARRHSDLYLWASLTPNGPSVRFHLLNSHTMDELKMTGNCLKGSRPIVIFDHTFDADPRWRLLKEILMQIFAVPKTARRAKPFVDHVTSFSIADGKIWFRNYQIVHETPLEIAASALADVAQEATKSKVTKARVSKHSEGSMSMNEIGPRFVLVPVKIFEGSFGGAVIWENPDFIAPMAKLANAKVAKAVGYTGRKNAENNRKERKVYLHAQEQADFEKSGRSALAKRNVFA